MSKTIRSELTLEREVLSSRFIAVLSPCPTPEDFDRTINEVSERYPKAAHYCYGARIGAIEKMGDDGEPSHSAGLQILSALRYRDLDYVSLIVVRYFGGTKLGLPRLTRTYREAAEDIIESAELYEQYEGIRVEMAVEYNALEPIRYAAKTMGFEIENTLYEEKILLTCSGDARIMERFLEKRLPEEITSTKSVTLLRRIDHDSSK